MISLLGCSFDSGACVVRVNLLLRRRDAALAGIEKQRNHHVQADKQRQTREQANLNRLQVCVFMIQCLID